jgi:hypothetical protein
MHTDQVEPNPVGANSIGFQYTLHSAKVKKTTAVENFNLLRLHTIMWGRGLRKKRKDET